MFRESIGGRTYLRPTAACFRSDLQRRNPATAIAMPQRRIDPGFKVSPPVQRRIECNKPKFPKWFPCFKCIPSSIHDFKFASLYLKPGKSCCERNIRMVTIVLEEAGIRTLQTGKVESRQKFCIKSQHKHLEYFQPS